MFKKLLSYSSLLIVIAIVILFLSINSKEPRSFKELDISIRFGLGGNSQQFKASGFKNELDSSHIQKNFASLRVSLNSSEDYLIGIEAYSTDTTRLIVRLNDEVIGSISIKDLGIYKVLIPRSKVAISNNLSLQVRENNRNIIHIREISFQKVKPYNPDIGIVFGVSGNAEEYTDQGFRKANDYDWGVFPEGSIYFNYPKSKLSLLVSIDIGYVLTNNQAEYQQGKIFINDKYLQDVYFMTGQKIKFLIPNEILNKRVQKLTLRFPNAISPFQLNQENKKRRLSSQFRNIEIKRIDSTLDSNIISKVFHKIFSRTIITNIRSKFLLITSSGNKLEYLYETPNTIKKLVLETTIDHDKIEASSKPLSLVIEINGQIVAKHLVTNEITYKTFIPNNLVSNKVIKIGFSYEYSNSIPPIFLTHFKEIKLEAAPTYKIGQTIDFTNKKKSNPYKYGGWQSIEAGGCRSLGNKSTLLFKTIPQNTSLLLETRINPIIEGQVKKSQKIIVIINGKRLQEKELNGEMVIQTLIPIELLQGDCIKVEYKYPDFQVPSKDTFVQNHYLQGLLFKSVKLKYIPKYQIGNTITFTQNGNYSDYITHGWNKAKKNGSWAIGRESGLLLKTGIQKEAKILESKIIHTTISNNKKPKRVIIKVNGKELGKYKLAKSMVIKTLIPVELLQGETILVEYKYPDSHNLSELNLWQDERARSMMFKSVKLKSVARYDRDTILSFGVKGNACKYKLNSWYDNTIEYSWLFGERADIALSFDKPTRNMELLINNGFPLLWSEKESYHVNIFLNNKFVTQWEVRNKGIFRHELASSYFNENTQLLSFRLNSNAIDDYRIDEISKQLSIPLVSLQLRIMRD